MKRLSLAALLLFPALALAQGITRNAVNASGRSSVPIVAPRFAWTGPLIPDDGGTVAHLWFDGRTLRDTKTGCTWSEVGTVPQDLSAPGGLAAAGPFAAANHFTCGSGSDPLDISTGDMTVCAVFSTSSLALNTLFANAQYNAAGYYFSIDGSARANFIYHGAACTEVARSGDGTIRAGNKLNVACGGLLSNVPWAWANGNPVQTGPSCTPAAGTSQVARVGVLSNGTDEPATTVKLYELWITTTPRSAALLDAVARAVFPN